MFSSPLKIAVFMICVFLTRTVVSAADLPILVIPDKLSYHARIAMPNKIVDQCHPETNMSYQLRGFFRKLKKHYSEFKLEAPTDGQDFHTLKMEIVDVFGLGGGAFSGSKRLCIRGELSDRDGNLIGTFYDYRTSMGNVMAMGMQGTCDIYRKVYHRMIKDILAWLKKPSMDAMIGDKEKAQITKDEVLRYERDNKR